MPSSTVSIAISEELARQLPPDPLEWQEILVLGLREWRIRKALGSYERGEGSLAYVAHQAGVSLREMLLLAYAHGLTPPVETQSGDAGL
jgi:hypothetical protein